MKPIILTLAIGLTPIAALAQDVSGIWKTQPGDTGGYAHVQMGPCAKNAAQVCGTLIKAYDKSGAEVAGYEHAGKAIVWNMTANGASNWNKGKIWAPDRDKTYNSKMALKGNALEVQGCVFGICRGQTWTRVK